VRIKVLKIELFLIDYSAPNHDIAHT